MAISKHIKNLIDLALQDRVLTYKERQTIIEEAKKTGVNVNETEEYLNDALHERLKSYTKEELTHCPACGALVPLISDDCLFCGTHLYKGEAKRQVIKVSGTAADIIREENRQTDIQQQNPNQCQCGAPFPLVSNICSYCGRVLHKNQDSEQNIKKLIMNIQASLARLRDTMRPSFWMVLKHRMNLICFYMAAAFLVLYTIFDDAAYIAISCCCFLPFAFIFMIFANRGSARKSAPPFNFTPASCVDQFYYYVFDVEEADSPVQRADNEYYDALHTYENYQRQTATIYGANPEAQQILADFATEISGFKKSRNRNRNIIALLMIAVMSIPAILYMYLPSAAQQYRADIASKPTIGEMQSYSKKIIPMPEHAVFRTYADYITVEGDVTLTFDALYERQADTIYANAIQYQLMADYLKIVSTGKKTERPDTCVLHLWLSDKDGKQVGKDLRPIVIWCWSDDSYEDMLSSGKGSIYAQFTSKKASRKRIKEVADSAYYFTIY